MAMSSDNLDTLRAFYEAEPDGEDVLHARARDGMRTYF